MPNNNWTSNARGMVTSYLRNYMNIHALIDFNLASPVLKIKILRGAVSMTSITYAGSTFRDKLNLNRIRTNADTGVVVYSL